MRARGWASCVVLGSLLLLSGCGPRMTTVSGKVTSDTTGEPIVGALVRVSGKEVRTAADGVFRLANVPEGTVKAAVVVTGYPTVEMSGTAGEEAKPIYVRVPDALLVIAVAERALEAKPARNAVVLIDGQPASVGTTIGPLPPGKHTVEVQGRTLMPFAAPITLRSGVNTYTATPSITATETYSRFLYQSQYGREKLVYRYFHPDEKKKVSLKKWTADSAGLRITSYKLGDVRMLSKWKSKLTGKTYTNVAEIDRSYKMEVTDPKYSDYGRTYTSSEAQHWVLLKGLWYFVHAK